MKIFVGIKLSDETRARLVEIRDELRLGAIRGSFSRPENIHLTLVFVGECTNEQAAAVKAAVDEVEFTPFTITIERLGKFKRIGTGDLWWAGMRECDSLNELQKKVATAITSRGITIDDRKYTPHITFGRDVLTKKEPWAIEPITEYVSSIHFMRSDRIDGVLTYISLYEKKAVK